jgi:hypothetical protein
MAQNFEVLSDAELELATGGAGLGISIDKGGIEVRPPNPLSIVGHLVGGAANLVGGVLQGAGGALSALGRLLHGGR